MPWLWFVGPLVFLLISFFVGLSPTSEQRHIRRAVERWIDELLGPLRTKKGKRSRRVRQVPVTFKGLLEAIGGGTRLTDLVLVPKNAYVAVRFDDALTAANHVSVLCKLAPRKGKKKKTPSFTCRPLPIVDGRAVENNGVIFTDDEEFTELYLVEGQDEKAIKKWLTPELREAVLELPDVWLRVDGDAMALTLYGYRDVDTLDALLDVADAFYAEKGATRHSLYGEGAASGEGEEAKSYRSKPKKRQGKKAESEEELELADAAARIKAGAVDVALYALGIFCVALTVGAFEWFHPSELFNSPDLNVDEPWQGGWTTKGFGAFVAAETLLVGTFVYQAWLATHDGQSVGKRMFGVKVVREDGRSVSFVHGVLLRSWVLGALPLVAAAIFASRVGFSARSFFEAVPTVPVFGVALVALGIGTISMATSEVNRGLHDRIAGTKVVQTAPFRLEPVQLGVEGSDPVVVRRLMWGGALIAAFIVVNLLTSLSELDFWFY